MKTKILFFILVLGITVSNRANPILINPAIVFSELYFDSHNNWTIELFCPYPSTSKFVDSVKIKSSADSSKLNIKLWNIYYYVITSDSLTAPLKIDPNKDEITVETYYHNGYGTQVNYSRVSFAGMSKYPDCSICKTSVTHFYNITEFLYISKKPSLGMPNSLDGIGEKLTGRIYDKDNKPVTNYFKMSNGNQFYFEIHEPITLNSDGTYSTIIYPESFFPDTMNVSKLSVRIPDFAAYRQTQDIEPIYFSYTSSDSVIVRDIHLKSNDYVVTGVEKADRNELPKNTELTLINYPNPFNSSTNFFVKFPDDIKEKSGDINIYNAAGKMVRSISIKNGSTFYWDGKDMNGSVMASGIYYYQLNIKNNVLKSGSMILLK